LITHTRGFWLGRSVFLEKGRLLFVRRGPNYRFVCSSNAVASPDDHRAAIAATALGFVLVQLDVSIVDVALPTTMGLGSRSTSRCTVKYLCESFLAASEHLQRLVNGDLLSVVQQGRFRY
jgi:hypothetical protein